MKKLVALASIALVGMTSLSSFAAGITQPSSSDLVTWGHTNGLTKFDSWATFNANASITREQAAKMIMMALWANPGLNIDTDSIACSFSDEESMDETLKQYVDASCTYGLFRGYKGAFMPKKFITREDVNTLVARALNILPQNSAYNVNVPTIKGSFLTRGELLLGLYHLDVIIKGQIHAEKEEALSAAQTELNAAIALWNSKDVNHYEVRQQLSCFCTPNSTHPVGFEVKDDMVVTGSLEDLNDTDKIPASQLTVTPMTVEDAFALIQDAIDRQADSINVTYNATYGFPTVMNLDYSMMMADEEQYYTYGVTVIE